MFYVIEGQDATGKDAQAQKLKEYLEAKGQEVIHYSESGTASENEFVRGIANLNYGHDYGIEDRTHALLYLINRYEQWCKLAEPCLRRGGSVIITRNWLSTLIYSGYGSGVSKSLIARIHHEVMPERYFKPDRIIILTLSDEERAKRLIAQGKRSAEFFKSKDANFQHKLNQAYLHVAKDYNIETMDTTGSIDEVFDRLLKTWKI